MGQQEQSNNKHEGVVMGVEDKKIYIFCHLKGYKPIRIPVNRKFLPIGKEFHVGDLIEFELGGASTSSQLFLINIAVKEEKKFANVTSKLEELNEDTPVCVVLSSEKVEDLTTKLLLDGKEISTAEEWSNHFIQQFGLSIYAQVKFFKNGQWCNTTGYVFSVDGDHNAL